MLLWLSLAPEDKLKVLVSTVVLRATAPDASNGIQIRGMATSAGIIDAAYAMCNDNALTPHIAVVSCCYQNRSTMNTADT